MNMNEALPNLSVNLPKIVVTNKTPVSVYCQTGSSQDRVSLSNGKQTQYFGTFEPRVVSLRRFFFFAS
jgi:hypothetical protein